LRKGWLGWRIELWNQYMESKDKEGQQHRRRSGMAWDDVTEDCIGHHSDGVMDLCVVGYNTQLLLHSFTVLLPLSGLQAPPQPWIGRHRRHSILRSECLLSFTCLKFTDINWAPSHPLRSGSHSVRRSPSYSLHANTDLRCQYVDSLALART